MENIPVPAGALPRTLFVNRELSWLEFNRRVLMEAADPATPLLDRLRFLTIYFSNLDEFFMVRVGMLSVRAVLEPARTDEKTGWTAREQIRRIMARVAEQAPLAAQLYRAIVSELKGERIDILNFQKLSHVDELLAKKYFTERIRPLLSPQVVDRNHPFPFLRNREQYVAVVFETKQSAFKFGIVPIGHLPAYYIFSVDGRTKVAFTADIVRRFVPALFRYTVSETLLLRLTRNTDLDPDAENMDFALDADARAAMEKLLRKRGRLAPVRVQLSNLPSEKLMDYLAKQLGTAARQMFISPIPLDFSFGMGLGKDLLRERGPELARLLRQEVRPVKHIDFPRGQALRWLETHELLLSFPYQSIQSFVDLLYQAADDPTVVSIKILLYRLAVGSKIVSALTYAAGRGKEVLCLLELRARFDERNNIDYSKVLEDAGCTILYGLDGYKVHSKLCLITRRSHDRIRYLTQVGTGNYNEATAEQYCDLSYITADETVGRDAADVFSALLLGELPPETVSLWIAPRAFKSRLLAMIAAETEKALRGEKARIALKVNSLDDMDVMTQLVAASQAGAEVELTIRGICCLCPGVEGYTENITVKSIVGRYLEHARIFVFGAGRETRVFLGSGDLLARNTMHRVECFAEVRDGELRRDVLEVMDAGRRDDRKGWLMQTDGSYAKAPDGSFSSQEYLQKYFSAVRAVPRPSAAGRWLRRLFGGGE